MFSLKENVLLDVAFYDIFEIISDNPDWITQNCSTFTIGSRCSKVRSLQRIWCSIAVSSYVYFCPYCSLACLYLVCNWKYGETYSEKSHR